MIPQTSFSQLEARNLLAANHFHDATINFGNSKDPSRQPLVCRIIHFPRNEDFIKRSVVANELASLLPPKPEYQTAALWGLGGSGKTQLALEYAYERCSDSACSVFWVHADSETSFVQDYKWIATKLGIGENIDGEELLKAVRVHIESLSQWVLVIDNADNLSLFRRGREQDLIRNRSLNLYDYVPRGTAGTVLWTSRDKRIVGSLVGRRHGINVFRMTDAESRSLFQAISRLELSTDKEQDGLAQLLAEVECLPLAIMQAAAYIRRTGMSITDYLQTVKQRKQRWEILKKSENDLHRRPEVSNSVLETWNISIEYIKKENTAAYGILSVLAYVDNQNIPFEMITAIWRARKESIVGCAPILVRVMAKCGAEMNWWHMAAVILAILAIAHMPFTPPMADVLPYPICLLLLFSIMTRLANSRAWAGFRNRNKLRSITSNDNTKSKLQGSSRGQTDNGDVLMDAIDAVTLLTEFSFLTPRTSEGITRDHNKLCYEMHKLVQEAIIYNLRMQKYGSLQETCSARIAFQVVDTLFPKEWQRQTWDQCERYLLHAQRTTEWAQVHKGEEDVARLLSRISNYLNDQGRWREKEIADLASVSLRASCLGERHPDTLSSQANLAETYNYQGRYNEAEKLKLVVLQARRDILGERDPYTISSKASLAATYHDLGKYDEMEKVSRDTFQLRKEVLGKRHPDVISSMADIAEACHEQGRYKEAEEIYTAVLGMRQVMLTEKHRDTIRSMVDLATTYYKQGRYKEDEKLSMEALALRREVLGEKHPDTVSSMARLAATYHAQGRYDEDEKLSVEVLALRREMLGEKHPDTISSMAGLAATYYAQGRYDEDEKLSVEALVLRREVLGEKHPDTISSMAKLAATYYAQGRYDEDEKLSVEVLALRREVLGEKHPDTLSSMAELVTTYYAQGRYDEDEKLSVEALMLRREVLGEKHPDTVSSMADLAATYHRQGRYDEAEKMKVEVLALRREVLGEKHPDTILTIANLASTYRAREKLKEAEELYTEVLQLRRTVLGDEHRDTIESVADLANTQDALRERVRSEKVDFL